MVSDHEQQHFANSVDSEIDRMSDLGVENPYMTVARTLDLDPHRDGTVVRDPLAAEAAKHRPRYSRSGGRSANEGSDSEHDPHWAVSREPLSRDHVMTNRVAAAVLSAMLQEMKKDPDADARHQAHLEEVRRRADAENNLSA